MLAKFGIGQRVRYKGPASFVMRPGEKATVVGISIATPDGVFVKTDAGRSYWVKADDLELDENANGEASESSPSQPGAPSP